MSNDQKQLLKYLALGGLLVFIFLLVNLQFLMAIIVLIVVLVSWILSRKGEQV